MSLNIDQLFDDPFFSGSPSAGNDDVPGIYQVAINGHGYIIEPSKYSRVTVPLRRESTDESVEPGEQTLNTGGAWRRSQDNWFLGAGQEYLDNRFAFVSVYTHSGEDPSVRTRFWRSKGVNPWKYGGLSLQPEYSSGLPAFTGSIIESVGHTVYLAAVPSSGILSGVQVLYSFSDTDPLSATPIDSPDATVAWPTITSITTDGHSLYLACGTKGIAVLVAGASAATWLRPAAPVPVVTPTGTAGSTHRQYYVVAIDALGNKSLPSAAGTTTTGNATLSVSNYDEVTWAAVPGAASYDLLIADTAHSIGTAIVGTSFTNDGAHGSLTAVAYTAPTETTQNFQASYVQYGNGYLLGASGAQLCSIAANGITTLVTTHRNPSFVWNAGCGSPTAIYIAGNCGGKSEVYGVQISTTNFALGGPYIAAQVGDGEQINDMLYYEGLVILATSLGVRAATDTSSTGHLDTGPVITSLGASTCLAVQGSYVYFGVTDYDDADGAWQGSEVTSGLGRLNLSQFSTTLLPAYATDVMSTITGETTSVIIANGVPWFTVAGSGMWTPTGDLVSSGYIEPGWVRYGTVEDKILVSVDVRHDPLEGAVQVEIVPFGRDSFLTTASVSQGSTKPPYYISAGNVVGEAFMPIVILTRAADPTKGPTLRRWTCRAMVVAARQDQIVCPIIWRSDVVSPEGDGTVLPMDLKAEWTFLKGLETSGTAFTYQEGSLTYTCFIDQVELQAEKWADDKSMLQGILSVKMLTVG